MKKNKGLNQKVQVGADTAKEISRVTAEKMGFIALLISRLRMGFVIKSYAIGLVYFILFGSLFVMLEGSPKAFVWLGVNLVLTPLSFIIYNDIKYLYYKKRRVRQKTVTIYQKGSLYDDIQKSKRIWFQIFRFMLYYFLYMFGIVLAPLGLIYLYIFYKRDLKINKSRV